MSSVAATPAFQDDIGLRIVRHAADACDFPMAGLGLADGSWAHWVQRTGLPGERLPSDLEFLRLLVQGDTDILVDDARQHPRLANSAMVQGPTGARSCAAFIVRQADGSPQAALLVVDRRRRPLHPVDAAYLRALAAVLGTRLGGAVDAAWVEDLVHRHADTWLLVLSREAPHGVVAMSPSLAYWLRSDEPGARILRQRLDDARPPAAATSERLASSRLAASRGAGLELLWVPTAPAADGRGHFWIGLVRPLDGGAPVRDALDVRIDVLRAWLHSLPPPRGDRLLGLVGLVQRQPDSPEAQQVVTWCLDRLALRVQSHLDGAVWTTAPAGLLAWALDVPAGDEARSRLEGLKAALSRPLLLDGATMQADVRLGVHRLAGHRPERDELHAALGVLRQAMTGSSNSWARRTPPDETSSPRANPDAVAPVSGVGEGIELAFDLYCSVKTGQIAKLQLVPTVDGTPLDIARVRGDPTRLIQALFTAIERWADRQRALIAGLDLLVELPAGVLARPEAVAVLQQFATRQPALACSLDLTLPDLSDLPIPARMSAYDLRALGYRLWWDRFGAAPFALSDLLDLGIVGVRLTGDWVGASNPLAPNRRLVLAAARVAQGLGLRTLADGVRSAGQWAFLRSIKCDAARGPLRGGLFGETEFARTLTIGQQLTGI